jgi:hypothetical protein
MSTVEKSANGVKGFIIFALGDPYFRVYHEEKDEHGYRKFTDYKICHEDLKITIHDDSASLYERPNDDNTLDYTSKVLGRVPK